MPTQKIKIPESTTTRKDLLNTIKAQFAKVLPALKEQLGEKKFEKRIKKASKVLVAGIKKAVEEKNVVAEKTAVVIKNAGKKKIVIAAKKPVKAAKKDLNTKKAGKKVK